MRGQVRFLVKVFGSDTEGNPFKQTAYAWDVSRWGARVDGIQCLRNPGQLVDVQYKGQTGSFIVVWMGKPGSKEHGHVGLKNLIPERNIFGVAGTAVCADSYAKPEKVHQVQAVTSEGGSKAPDTCVAPKAKQNRRQFTRHRCVGTVEFRIPGSNTSISGDLADLSLGGCYVKAQATCPKGTILELVLEVGKTRLHAQGRVAAVTPANGMGIEFTRSGSSISRLPGLINIIRLPKN
jgi:PilZ domain-containing protein